MFTKKLAIELGRRRKELVVLAVHPGTVATDLSAPFASRLGPDRRFPVERGAAQVLAVIDGAGRSGERSIIPRVIQSEGDGSGFLWRCCTNQPKQCGSAFRRDDPAGRSGSLKRTTRFPLRSLVNS